MSITGDAVGAVDANAVRFSEPFSGVSKDQGAFARRLSVDFCHHRADFG